MTRCRDGLGRPPSQKLASRSGLLFLDQPNDRLDDELFAELGLAVKPFASAF